MKILLAQLGLFVCFLTSALYGQSSMPEPKQERLLNGLKVLMWTDEKADKVTVKVRVHSGSAFDPQGKEGVMQMLSDNLFSNEAAREFFTEDLGGSVEIITNYDYIQINVSSKPESFLTMLETVATAVANPAIDKDTTAKLRTVMLASLAIREGSPDYVADQAVAKRLFGTFPYGRPQYGTADSLKKINFGDLLEAKDRFFTADNATVSIYGNFDKALAFKAIRRYFGGWAKADKKIPSTFRQPDAAPAGLQTLLSPKADVSAIRFAFRGTSRTGKDFAAACVFASILDARLRNRVPSAHAGSIFVRNEQYFLPGILKIGFAAGKNDLGSGNGKIDAGDLVSKALSEPVTEAEFQAARTENASRWKMRTEESFWLDNDTYKTASIEADKSLFDNVTLAEVRAYSERLRSAPMVSVLVNTPPAPAK